MMKFKEDGIGVSDLLKLIPDDLLLDLAAETKVDYQVKKLLWTQCLQPAFIWAD